MEIEQLQIAAEIARILRDVFFPTSLQLGRAVVALMKPDNLRLELGAQPVSRRGEAERLLERGDGGILIARALMNARDALQRLCPFGHRRVLHEVLQVRQRARGQPVFEVALSKAPAQVQIRRRERDRSFPSFCAFRGIASLEPRGAELEEDLRALGIILREKSGRLLEGRRGVCGAALIEMEPREREQRERLRCIELRSALVSERGVFHAARFAQEMPEHELAREGAGSAILLEELSGLAGVGTQLPEAVEHRSFDRIFLEQLLVTLGDARCGWLRKSCGIQHEDGRKSGRKTHQAEQGKA
jgi:hypothetical protein